MSERELDERRARAAEALREGVVERGKLGHFVLVNRHA